MARGKRNILQEIVDANEQHNALLDTNGQPLNRQYSKKRLNDRSIDELIGISRGIIADSVVNQAEANFLLKWLDANIRFCDDPIVNKLYYRIHEMLSDNLLDEDETKELMETLSCFTGEKMPSEVPQNMTMCLPFDDPPPGINFENYSFCLTGTFAYGPRRLCHAVICDLGGTIMKKVSSKLDYLVVGCIGSTDWIHTSYGRKIEDAVRFKETGIKISIISEDHWARYAFKK